MRVSIICAMGKNRAIGRRGGLPWRIPGDLKRFKQLTLGHVIVMGRKTFDSIGRVLPGRTHVIVSRNPAFHPDKAHVCGSVEEALTLAQRLDAEIHHAGEIFVVGGGQVYEQSLPGVDRLYLTVVDDVPSDADVFFPDYSAFNRVIQRESVEENGIRYELVTLER